LVTRRWACRPRRATYWLAVGDPDGAGGLVSSGPAANAPYSAWVATEDYHYCDYVAYPLTPGAAINSLWGGGKRLGGPYSAIDGHSG